jgi:hypothetical protein
MQTAMERGAALGWRGGAGRRGCACVVPRCQRYIAAVVHLLFVGARQAALQERQVARLARGEQLLLHV